MVNGRVTVPDPNLSFFLSSATITPFANALPKFGRDKIFEIIGGFKTNFTHLVRPLFLEYLEWLFNKQRQ